MRTDCAAQEKQFVCINRPLGMVVEVEVHLLVSTDLISRYSPSLFLELIELL